MEPAGCTRAQAQSRLDQRHVPAFAVSSAVVGGFGLAILTSSCVLELWRYKRRRTDDRGVEVHAALTSVGLAQRF